MRGRENMKKHLAAFAALTFTAIGAMSALGADANGNIRSIDAIPIVSESLLFPNTTAPLGVGQKLYIRVRLLNRNWDDDKADADVTRPWYFRPSSLATSSIFAISGVASS